MTNLEEKYGEIAICIATRARPSEIGLLLQSLRTQTYKKFSVFILEDNPEDRSCLEFYFVNYLVTRLKLEGHLVFFERTPYTYGVSKARQRLYEWASKGDYQLFARLDDDVILEPDYLERLVKVIDQGYDIASGVTPPLTPSFIRNSETINIADEVVLDKEGNFLIDYDDCGFQYTGEKIIPCHHFRSCALMKRQVHEKVSYNSKLSKHGYREETLFSFKAQIEGFKIGVDLQAKAFHLNCPSGGERFNDQMQLAQFNQSQLKDWVKENKDKLCKLFPYRELTEQELKRDNNLAK